MQKKYQQVIPCVYALLPDKTQQPYAQFFRNIQQGTDSTKFTITNTFCFRTSYS